MKKNELMTGDIVVLKSGKLAVVIRNEKEDYLLYQECGWECLEDYDDDMVYLYPSEDGFVDAIMQVYRVPSGGIGFADYEDEEAIYERDSAWVRTIEGISLDLDEQNDTEENDRMFIIAQQFYGNRTGTEIERCKVDLFLRGCMDEDLFADSDKVNRKIVRVPNSDNIVIVYDQAQEDENDKLRVSCEIPEIGFKIHTRCFACRMDKNGKFQSLEKGDTEKFIKYFTC